jgi:hypothetical protein
MSFSSRSKSNTTSCSRNTRQHPSTIFFCSLALGYSVLLFFIANYLPLITNGAAEILTWVVYSRIIRGIVTFMTVVLVFIIFIRWPLIERRKLFLLQLLPFVAATAWFFSRLGESVNEYIHYPQYATCVLLWFAALSRLCRNNQSSDGGAGLLVRLQGQWGPLGLALAISAMLGLAEEGFQYLAPRRAFDLQDIALNLMGVWLGGMIVWIIRDSDNDLPEPSTDGCGPDG